MKIKEDITTEEGKVLKAGTEITRDYARYLGLIGKKNAKRKQPKSKPLKNESEIEEQLDQPD